MQKRLITSTQASVVTGFTPEHLRKKVPSFEIILGVGKRKRTLHLYDEEQIIGMKKKGFKS